MGDFREGFCPAVVDDDVYTKLVVLKPEIDIWHQPKFLKRFIIVV